MSLTPAEQASLAQIEFEESPVDPLTVGLVGMAMAAGWADPVTGAHRAITALGLRGAVPRTKSLRDIAAWLRENAPQNA